MFFFFFNFLLSEIVNFFDQMNQNVRGEDDEVDIVNVESDTEDEQVSPHELQNENEPEKIPNAAEYNDAEMVSKDVDGHEPVPIEQTASNSNADTRDAQDAQAAREAQEARNDQKETVKPNDDGKENVRPQSTPIAKAEAPIDNSKPSEPLTDANEMVEIKPLADKPGPCGKLQTKKRLKCPCCADTFNKKTTLIKHLKYEHKKKPSTKHRIEMANILIRKPSQLHKRKYIEVDDDDDEDAADDVDEDEDDDDEIKADGNYFVISKSGMIKRQKTNGPKFVYMAD